MELVLIRGLPGSGKSTIARSMVDHVHFEADMFFTDDSGAYKYNPKKVKIAHEWCQSKVFAALAEEKNVVVSNTFTRLFEMAPYLEMAEYFGISVKVIEAKGRWANVHGVPDEVIEKMSKRWEALVWP